MKVSRETAVWPSREDAGWQTPQISTCHAWPTYSTRHSQSVHEKTMKSPEATQCLSTDGRITKMWDSHTVKYYLAIKVNETLIYKYAMT